MVQVCRGVYMYMYMYMHMHGCTMEQYAHIELHYIESSPTWTNIEWLRQNLGWVHQHKHRKRRSLWWHVGGLSAYTIHVAVVMPNFKNDCMWCTCDGYLLHAKCINFEQYHYHITASHCTSIWGKVSSYKLWQVSKVFITWMGAWGKDDTHSDKATWQRAHLPSTTVRYIHVAWLQMSFRSAVHIRTMKSIEN